MLQNYLNKSGKLNAITQSKLNHFNGMNHICKLSDFNTGRTSNFASVLLSDLFIISYERDKIVKAGFSHPRKQIIGNLSKGLKLTREQTTALLLKNGIALSQRAETLSVDDWIRLTKSFFAS